MFQKLRHSDTCNQVKSCTKHGRPNQSQRKLNVALKADCTIQLMFFHNTLIFQYIIEGMQQQYTIDKRAVNIGYKNSS